MIYFICSNKDLDSNDEPLYWNNQWGWVNISEADSFSEEEKTIFNLPINGFWKAR